MIYQYQYSIAGLRIRCRIPFPVVIQDEAKEFLFLEKKSAENRNEADKTDAEVDFLSVGELSVSAPDAIYRADRIYGRDAEGRDQVHYCVCQGMPPYACSVWEENGTESLHLICRILRGNEFRFSHSRMISDHIGMETLFLKKDCLLLHAALIRWRGQGILFSAPSGTGKSTQAGLWKKYEGADILNGDRAAVRKVGGRWTAYGLPYAGSSGIYRNESAPVATVVILSQGQENRIRRLEPLEIIRYLYPETTVHFWETAFVERTLTLLTKLAGEMTCFFLECRPDREAVDVLKEKMTGGNVL